MIAEYDPVGRPEAQCDGGDYYDRVRGGESCDTIHYTTVINEVQGQKQKQKLCYNCDQCVSV